jgi:hypothetical protein
MFSLSLSVFVCVCLFFLSVLPAFFYPLFIPFPFSPIFLSLPIIA